MNDSIAHLPPPDPQHRDMDASLIRGLAWIGSVKWGTQLLAWSSSIIVARLLTPDDYGIVGMAIVYLGLITLLTEFGVGTAVVTLRHLSQEQIAQLNGLSLLLGLAGFILSCMAAIPLGYFFRSPRLPWVVVAMSTSFVISSLQSVPSALLQREFRFRLVSLIDGSRSLTLSLATILFAWYGLRYWTLVLGSILGALIGTVLTLTRLRCGFAWPRWGSLHHIVRFTRDVLIGRIAWYSYSNSDFVISGRVLGQTALGAYTIAWNLANIPVEKITGVLNGVTPAFFSAAQTETALLRRYLLNLTEGVALVTLPLSIGMGLVVQEFVLVMLGSKWQPVVAPLRFLALYVTVRSMAPMIPVVLNVVGQSRSVMWNSIMAAMIMPSSFYIGSHWGNSGIALAWLLAYPIVAIPLFHRAFQKIELPWSVYLTNLRAPATGSLVMAIVVLVSRRLLPVDYALSTRLAVEVLGGAAAYVLVIGAIIFKRRHTLLRLFRLLRPPLPGTRP